jgi:glycosyltransferase involved in cell wall biosynthesis
VRVAVISHTYVVAANRGKLDRLAAIPDTELLLIVPRRWRNRDLKQAIDVELEVQPAGLIGYKVVVLNAWPIGFGSLITYSPLTMLRCLHAFRPHVVCVEEEPWSIAALELSFIARILRTRLVFFTWENLDRRLPFLSRLIRRVVLGAADGAIAGNEEGKRLLIERRFRKPIVVLPQLGVDQDTFFPDRSPRSEPTFVIGYVGRLVRQKGILILLEAAARLDNARLLFVGRGPLRSEIVDRAASLGLHGRLEIHDDVQHGQVAEYIRKMSVLVLPSLSTTRWKEQFGHVLIEAMACGVPVVGSDSGAIPEVVGEAGIVVKEGSPDALAEELQRLMDDSRLREAFRAKGQARVWAEFSNSVIASRLAQFLVKV